MTEKTITELLAAFGITHARDNGSSAYDHELFMGGVSIGHYDAGGAVKLLTALREYEKGRAGRRQPEQLGAMDW